jgi:hypothetical protein
MWARKVPTQKEASYHRFELENRKLAPFARESVRMAR